MEEHVLCRSEIELFVSNLSPSKFDELGQQSWFESHKRLHMLYQELLLETTHSFNEIIKETFLMHGKMKFLVYEAITLSVWRHNVFPKLCNQQINKEKVFPIFVMLYHEATAFGLLESLAFHSDCVESLQDTAVELLDYCVQNILQIINRKIPQVLHEKLSEMSSKEELEHYDQNIVHNLALRSICVLRYIAEALELLPLSISSRFYENHDIPMLLCQVFELSPWITTDLDGKPYQFIDGNWKQRAHSDEPLNKSEGQTWLCVRQVLLDPRLMQHYELSDYRTRQLCKLIRYLNDDVLDQLSPLAELKHFLCQLSVASPPPSRSKPLILELVAEYREKLIRKYSNKWENIASKQAKTIEDLDIKQIQSIAHGLAQAYTTLDLVEPEPARCANCGEPATKRCSRCKTDWYCGRECQVKMWNKHKSVCFLVAEESNK